MLLGLLTFRGWEKKSWKKTVTETGFGLDTFRRSFFKKNPPKSTCPVFRIPSCCFIWEHVGPTVDVRRGMVHIHSRHVLFCIHSFMGPPRGVFWLLFFSGGAEFTLPNNTPTSLVRMTFDAGPCELPWRSLRSKAVTRSTETSGKAVTSTLPANGRSGDVGRTPRKAYQKKRGLGRQSYCGGQYPQKCRLDRRKKEKKESNSGLAEDAPCILPVVPYFFLVGLPASAPP